HAGHIVWRLQATPFQKAADRLSQHLDQADEILGQAEAQDPALRALRIGWMQLQDYAREHDTDPNALLTRLRDGEISDTERADERLMRAATVILEPAANERREGYRTASASISFYRMTLNKLRDHPATPLSRLEAESIYALIDSRHAEHAYPLPSPRLFPAVAVVKAMLQQFAEANSSYFKAWYDTSVRLENHEDLKEQAKHVLAIFTECRGRIFDVFPEATAEGLAIIQEAGRMQPYFEELAEHGLSRSNGWTSSNGGGLSKHQLSVLLDVLNESPRDDHPLNETRRHPAFSPIHDAVLAFVSDERINPLLRASERGNHPVLTKDAMKYNIRLPGDPSPSLSSRQH
ncbi:MAG: hypothetical protein J0L97_05835, partial [Alphaproteobacteria bacterium]|nr:hypothetical protein [Alphaproteobacteria bacterium]